MTREQATILIRLIEAGTESNWSEVAEMLLEMGYIPSEVADACKELSEIAQEPLFIVEEDF